MVIACPVFPETPDDKTRDDETPDANGANAKGMVGESMVTQTIDDLPFADRIDLIELPFAYKLPDFWRHYRATRQLLRQTIQDCQYLYFGLSSNLIGDWAAIASLEAQNLGRPYSICMANVHHEKFRQTLQNKSGYKRLIKEKTTLPLLKKSHYFLMSKAALGLFQGQDCYQAYGPFCPNSHCVYLVRTAKTDFIPPSVLQAKQQEILAKVPANTSLPNTSPLKICYVGRAADMKGPLQWVRALHALAQSGVQFQATWIGEGPRWQEMQTLAQELKIHHLISFPGFVDDRRQVLTLLRQSHLFLFCHTTPESARCLIEALVSGCPIVGYGSPYAEDLVSSKGGGEFVNLHDWPALAKVMESLAQNRQKLRSLVEAAAQSGRFFDQDSVFEHRIGLIKRYLG
jgi:glycosyltransferase involved in cell wall biosynthesis